MEDNVLSMLLNNSTILSKSSMKGPSFLGLYHSGFSLKEPANQNRPSTQDEYISLHVTLPSEAESDFRFDSVAKPKIAQIHILLL